MWIKTQIGNLVNTDRLVEIAAYEVGTTAWVSGYTQPVKDYAEDAHVTFGIFDTYTEAEAYLRQLEHTLTGAISFDVTGKPDDPAAIRNITLKETDHD